MSDNKEQSTSDDGGGVREATAAQHWNLKGEPARFVRNGELLTCECRDCKAALATLSPPAGERREAIAFKIYGHSNNPKLWDNPNSVLAKDNAYALADLLLASGLVQDAAAIRADEREKCAEIADDASDNSDKASNTYDGGSGSLGYEAACTDIAAAIRSARDESK